MMSVAVVLSLLMTFAGGDPDYGPPLRAVDTPAEFHGIWQSVGYGEIVDVSDGAIRAYDYAEGVCVDYSDDFEVADWDYELRVSLDGQSLLLKEDENPYTYLYRRIDDVPNICKTTMEDSPQEVLNALASYVSAHYAFLDLYGVDWEAVVASAQAKLSPEMSEQALFDLLSTMFVDIKDGHVTLRARIDDEFTVFRAFAGPTTEAMLAVGRKDGLERGDAEDRFNGAYWNDGIRDALLEGEAETVARGRIRFGMVDDDIGYIAIITEGGYTNEDEDDEFAALDAAMDEAIGYFKDNNAQAVIIDLSVNFGGYDSISRAIAGRFASQRTFAYTKRAEDAPASPAVPLYIEPSEYERFTGPVYLLTSDITVSAGEILTMSLRALPNVTHVGQKTRGALSDVLEKTLPNGWAVTLSNEVYTDSEGLLWEGRGIPPEIEIPVFDLPNPPAGHVDAVREVAKFAKERSAAN